jgi:hypothetical protein
MRYEKMTSTQALSYVIIALDKLGYRLNDIKKIRQQIESEFELYDEQEAEQRVIHVLSQLITKELV